MYVNNFMDKWLNSGLFYSGVSLIDSVTSGGTSPAEICWSDKFHTYTKVRWSKIQTAQLGKWQMS